VTNEVWSIKLDAAIKECDAHVSRLDRAYILLGDFFPLSPASLSSLDELRIEHVDQFVFRFSRLQDAMGARLFPSVYVLLAGDTGSHPFIDILMTLEKFNVIEDAQKWQFFRDLRNNLAHEYPDSVEESSGTLNLLREKWPEFRTMYLKVKTFAQSHM
jgi:hypothetical protein